ncbi:hypothetical protein CYMTET_6727 [Cymbomonas tetramitiformis]|uniref:Polyketide synthase dehydratase domain-containing protein n=1 Tax=Cymbomonas tetramitiformis TaxID=36881 RepID=A0AAE0LHR1_9CHLO|nr:hypothetical protein CYMTET_6727 [Cymbomonas tetramitiformis]|eukprot:gene8251-9804_t
MSSDPRFEVNEDGTAKDPVAFRAALREDAQKVKIIEEDPQLAAALLGDDTSAMNEVLKSIFEMQKKKAEQDQKDSQNMTSIDKMRASATVPRDPVVLYQGMLESGLQYGPAFRLLTDVWVPEEVNKAQMGSS